MPPEPVTRIEMGNMVVSVTKHFNWFSKLMMKLLLQWDVKDIKKL